MTRRLIRCQLAQANKMFIWLSGIRFDSHLTGFKKESFLLAHDNSYSTLQTLSIESEIKMQKSLFGQNLGQVKSNGFFSPPASFLRAASPFLPFLIGKLEGTKANQPYFQPDELFYNPK